MRRDYKFWTTSEIAIVKSGIIPPGRTMTACRRICSRLGIIFPGKKNMKTSEKGIKK